MGRFRFNPHEFRLGMRTFKTGLAIFLVLALFSLLGFEGLQIGCLTAVFSLRENFDKSLHFGTSQIVGNTIGGVYSLIFFGISELFNKSLWVTLVFVPIFTMLTIMTNVAIDNKSGIIGAVAALLIITLSIPEGDTFTYTLARIFETFIGVFVATLVNADIDRIREHLVKRMANKD
nr:aromatic acid exporter family protein [Streptococcus sobrinus]